MSTLRRDRRCSALYLALVGLPLTALAFTAYSAGAEGVRGSATYRPEVVGTMGVVATGRHFAAEAGMRMLARGGNAVDAGVAATFAAAVSEISHFGLGGEVPIILYLADRNEVVVINGQGTAPATASRDIFSGTRSIPANGPSAGTIPAVVDALSIALAEFGTRSLAEALQPAIELADGFPWYEYLTAYLKSELPKMALFPSGARAYLQGPGGTIPAVGSIFRQPDLGRTLRALVDAEQRHLAEGRKAAIYAARDRFYRGDLGQRIAAAVQDAGGLMTAADLASYRGRVERPTRLTLKLREHTYDIFKTDFGAGAGAAQTLMLLEGFDLDAWAQLDRVHPYGHGSAQARAGGPGRTLWRSRLRQGALERASSPGYAAQRRTLIDPRKAHNGQRPGDPWKFEPRSRRRPAEP
jgi:gamma-glutamyltranspeptidase/glutathione hydrolase